MKSFAFVIIGLNFIHVSDAFNLIQPRQLSRLTSSSWRVRSQHQQVDSKTPLKQKVAPSSDIEAGKNKNYNFEKKNILSDVYLHHLEQRPLVVKSLMCCLVATIGDIISQKLIFSSSIDLKKLFAFSLVQFLYFGPMMHYWFMTLESFTDTLLPSNKEISTNSKLNLSSQILKVSTQMIVDQTIGSVVIIGLFFYVFELLNALVDGSLFVQGFPKILSAGTQSVRLHLWETLKANWKLWPLANTINFAFVPLQHRTLFSSIVAVIWNIFLSGVVRKT